MRVWWLGKIWVRSYGGKSVYGFESIGGLREAIEQQICIGSFAFRLALEWYRGGLDWIGIEKVLWKGVVGGKG